MKKRQKHITFSTLLAIIVLSTQTAFFPLHYFLTHHNTPLHTQPLAGQDQHFQSNSEQLPANASDEEGCYWCDLFAHQGYFLEKFTDFTFQSGESGFVHPLAFAYVSLKSELPGSRGPPACQLL